MGKEAPIDPPTRSLDPELEMAKAHVASSIRLIEAQTKLVRSYEGRGWNATAAKRLLLNLYRTHRIMVEHRDRLIEGERATKTAQHNGLAWPKGPKDLVHPRHQC